LIEYCDVLIAGREDCQKSIGIFGEGDPERPEYFESLSKSVMDEFPTIHTVAITIRDTKTAEHHDWSSCIRTQSEMLFSRKYEIRDIVDRVATGDAFAGALIYALCEQMPTKSAIEFAAAANCLKHSVEGDFNLVSASEVQAMLSSGTAGRVQR
jgi:2-dehydro-3-deoxygluconokinase